MAEISIVVPVYNVEKYLEKCVDSLISQTFNDIEIILVDDGSVDKSGELCDLYADRDSRIKVIHQDNGGLSAARNTGIEAAGGKYIGFVDSDDYVEEDMYELLYNNIIKSGAQVSVCGVYNAYIKGNKPQYGRLEEFLCPASEAFGYTMIGQKIPATICNKLIDMRIAKQLRFPEGRLYEDAFFTTDLMQRISTVYVSTAPKYYYVHREGSITTALVKKRDFDLIYAYRRNLKLVLKKYPELEAQARFRFYWACFALFDRILVQDNYTSVAGYDKMKRYLKRNWLNTVRNPYFYRTRKIGAVALRINVKLYRALIFMNTKKNQGLLR